MSVCVCNIIYYLFLKSVYLKTSLLDIFSRKKLLTATVRFTKHYDKIIITITLKLWVEKYSHDFSPYTARRARHRLEFSNCDIQTSISQFRDGVLRGEGMFSILERLVTAVDRTSEFISRLLRAGIELLEALKNATLLINGGSSYTERTALFRISESR